ncbi:ABC transporter ATP-binding protein [Peptoniphilus sp. KCTC 25270]|uniref:ABC transporter ATP-binding protein n=1 Tax=Peptoniphilus sp. KCTC 25270 TaxID=2897414 RepID=UPI001E5A751B|nr:ABC transporter ATP-binding protein [Peptoniphilus sp. KCTC 25270]MCD1146581.1 ABC transporter ATP-binding protein [Peptoniphilus sp. KCTC 25270]
MTLDSPTNSYQNNAVLTVEGVMKSYQNIPTIEDIHLQVKEGEIVSLLGLSGVGKTTLFNVISGVGIPDKGKVFFQGMDVTGKPGHISYMLQKDLLIEQKNIMDNVILPLILKGEKKSLAQEKAKKLLPMFGLEGYEKSYPNALSGGMRQRAAFLRTYFASEEVVLLDEPFSALDAITKKQMHKWYQEMSETLGLTTLFITHDIDEALLLSDRIYLMTGSPGRISFELPLKKRDGEDFSLTPEFLEYKKQILRELGLE